MILLCPPGITRLASGTPAATFPRLQSTCLYITCINLCGTSGHLQRQKVRLWAASLMHTADSPGSESVSTASSIPDLYSGFCPSRLLLMVLPRGFAQGIQGHPLQVPGSLGFLENTVQLSLAEGQSESWWGHRGHSFPSKLPLKRLKATSL